MSVTHGGTRNTDRLTLRINVNHAAWVYFDLPKLIISFVLNRKQRRKNLPSRLSFEKGKLSKPGLHSSEIRSTCDFFVMQHSTKRCVQGKRSKIGHKRSAET